MSSSVSDLINEINNRRLKDRREGIVRYDTKSQKDELSIMRAMLNDQSYGVSVYDNSGKVTSTYYPAKEIRKSVSSIIQGAIGLSEEEADHAMNEYEFKNADAQGMINISKEFINTYLQTGKKLPLGGRDRSNVTLIRKTMSGGTMLYPTKVNREKGKFESQEIVVEEYDTIKVIGPCPDWLKHKKT